MRPEEKALKQIYEYLEEALNSIDSAIAVRDDETLTGLRDLDLIRAEVHALTCRNEFAKVRP